MIDSSTSETGWIVFTAQIVNYKLVERVASDIILIVGIVNQFMVQIPKDLG